MSRYDVVRPVVAAYEALIEGSGAPLPEDCSLMVDLKRSITMLKEWEASYPTAKPAAVEEIPIPCSGYDRALRKVHSLAEQLDSAIMSVPPEIDKSPAIEIATARLQLVKARVRVEILDPTPKRKD